MDPARAPSFAREVVTPGDHRRNLARVPGNSHDERREHARDVMTSLLRVLIADLPDLQADVLATLVGAEPDMLIVGRGAGPEGLVRDIKDLAPDVVGMARSLGEATRSRYSSWPSGRRSRGRR